MNKKGFLKILEAILAIVIVFTTVVLVLPKVERNTGQIPPDLELTANEILKEVQVNDQYRNCVLTNDIDCIGTFVKTLRPAGNAWDFALKICNSEGTISCKYYSCITNCATLSATTDNIFIDTGLPKDKDIYTKSVVLSVVDPVGNQPTPTENIIPNQVLKLYFWLK